MTEKFSCVENAFRAIADDVQTFPNGRQWASASGQYQVFTKMVSCRWWLINDDGMDRKWGGGSDQFNRLACDAATYLRDHLLQTTGERIWGLTFTVFPDGKFNIEYDYNKPEGYEEEPVYQDFLNRCMDELRQKTDALAAAWGLGTETNWQLEQTNGALYFSFADGRRVSVPVQIVGTYNTDTSTFLWGWDHPSVAAPLRRGAEAVRAYGQQESIERFTQKKLDCTQDEAWEFTAAAAHLDNAAGAYRGPAGNTLVFMTFGSAQPDTPTP